MGFQVPMFALAALCGVAGELPFLRQAQYLLVGGCDLAQVNQGTALIESTRERRFKLNDLKGSCGESIGVGERRFISRHDNKRNLSLEISIASVHCSDVLLPLPIREQVFVGPIVVIASKIFDDPFELRVYRVTKNHRSRVGQINRGARSAIMKRNFRPKLQVIVNYLKPPIPRHTEIYPRSQLALQRFAGEHVGAAGFLERYEHQSNAEYADRHPYDGGDAHSARPSRHSSLGFKIIFVMLALTSGMSLAGYAIAQLRRGNTDTAALYGYAGAVSITLGIAICATLIGAL